MIRDLSLCHATLRTQIPLVCAAVNAESKRAGFELRIFETARPPSRQRQLFLRGRDPASADYGRTVTKATAYQSAHQFGEGVDLVFVGDDGRWTWDAHAPWDLLTSEARAHGLETLSFEKPHVQIGSFDWRGRGRGPDDDAGWLAWLRGQTS